MKFFLCLLALAVATVNAGFLKGGLVGGYYGGGPAYYGGGYASGYGGYGGYADTRIVNVVHDTVPVVHNVAPVVHHVAPVVQHVAPVSVVRVAHVPTYSYRTYSAPAIYKTVSVHAAPSYGGWYKKK